MKQIREKLEEGKDKEKVMEEMGPDKKAKKAMSAFENGVCGLLGEIIFFKI